MRVLFVGDVVGKPGRVAMKALLPRLRERYKLDMVMVNGENAAGGFGLTASVGDELLKMADVITTGNHVWDKKEALQYLDREPRIIRPLNYPPRAPGSGVCLHAAGSEKVAVLNAEGRVFMPNLDCPFRGLDAALEALPEGLSAIIVDFHAEATSEKIAMGYYLDGRVTAVVGTHTHVQTADEKILPGGTAYVTDVGMTGPIESVIGVEKEQILERFLTGMPVRFEVARGAVLFSAVVIETEPGSLSARAIQRLQLTYP
ncbi:MAG: TIGR00282 family metallophosphoesterase [Nitrospirota bacterium]|jgi:metallophosphoesterase (TIGR00282 family)